MTDVVREEDKERGTPRKRKTYRAWRRNNAVKWAGVETDRVQQHPQLEKKISKRGEVHYV